MPSPGTVKMPDDRLREADIAPPAGFERVAADVLAVDVIDAGPRRFVAATGSPPAKVR